MRDGSIPAKNVEVQLFGAAPASVGTAWPGEIPVRWEGVQPRRIVGEAAAGSDLLLLPVRLRADRQLPGKLYEILPLRAPVLVVAQVPLVVSQYVHAE